MLNHNYKKVGGGPLQFGDYIVWYQTNHCAAYQRIRGLTAGNLRQGVVAIGDCADGEAAKTALSPSICWMGSPGAMWISRKTS
jgi:hypothetical protein